MRWQDLKDLFRKAGTVLRADVSLGPDNRSRGYGTVLLASAEDARKAVGELKLQFNWRSSLSTNPIADHFSPPTASLAKCRYVQWLFLANTYS